MNRRLKRLRSIVFSGEDPRFEEVLRAAQAYLKSGLSMIPIASNGQKRPDFPLLPKVVGEDGVKRCAWRHFKKERPTIDQIGKWYGDKKLHDEQPGIAIIAGSVSGNLEIIDVDNQAIMQPFVEAIEERCPGLTKSLVQVRSPRPGYHLYYRCETIGGCRKLAQGIKRTDKGQKPTPLIEIKGEGGYCLAPPSPSGCHPTGRCYTYASDHDLTDIPTISVQQRDHLLDAAASLNQWKSIRAKSKRPSNSYKSLVARESLPGRDFDVRAEWADVLLPAGFSYNGEGAEGTETWTRPGKSKGVSVTTGYGELDLMFVFTSNADPFEQEEWYTKFAAYTLLEHDGDFHLAASELKRRGFGKPTTTVVSTEKRRRPNTGFKSRRRGS